MKTVFTLKDLVKYIIFIGVVYTLIRIIPSREISIRDIVLIIAIISVGFISIDCLNSNSEYFANAEKNTNTPLLNVPENTIKNTVQSSNLTLNVVKNKDSNNDNNCGVEMEKLKQSVAININKLQLKIKELESKPQSEQSLKYMNFLIADLIDYQVLDNNDVGNIAAKIKSKISTVDEIIVSLEKLKLSSKSKKLKNKIEDQSEYSYGNLPPDFYNPLGNAEISKWDSGYTILNTDKWQVPMPRPPICINNSPCKVCPNNDETYPINLSEWNNSKKISNIEISKDWANKQTDPKESSNLDIKKILYNNNKNVELQPTKMKKKINNQQKQLQKQIQQLVEQQFQEDAEEDDEDEDEDEEEEEEEKEKEEEEEEKEQKNKKIKK
jgi:hypothetical protein